MLTNIESVTKAVEITPGLTAHHYKVREGARARNSWVYAAFRRAVRARRVVAAPGPRKGTTIYFPAPQ